MLWTDVFVFFPCGKGGSGVLANCCPCGTEATLPFSAGPVCSSFSAEACAILQALCWSRKHQQICHFSSLLFDSRSVLSSIFSFTFLFSSSSGSIRLQWVPGHSFLSGNDSADERARQWALLAPSAIPCSLYLLISHTRSSPFSDWRHTVSSKFFDPQVPSISTEELVLPRHARCVLSHLRCNGHSLLLSSYLSRIDRIENPSCTACGTRPGISLFSFLTVQLRTLCVARSMAIFFLWSRPWGVARLLGLMVFRLQLIPRKRSDNNNNSKTEITDALLRNKGS